MNTNIIVSSDPQRARYERLLGIMRQVGFGEFYVYPHMLRVEQDITSPVSSRYTFSFFENAQADKATEIKLNRNDAFFWSHIGLGIYNATAGQEGHSQIYYTPDPLVFTTANEATALRQIYQGNISLQTKPVERLNMSTLPLEYNYGWKTQGATGVSLGSSVYGPDMDSKGLFGMTPEVILSGDQDNDVILDIGPGTFTAAVAASGVNSIVLLAWGYLVVQGANLLGRWYRQGGAL